MGLRRGFQSGFDKQGNGGKIGWTPEKHAFLLLGATCARLGIPILLYAWVFSRASAVSRASDGTRESGLRQPGR